LADILCCRPKAWKALFDTPPNFIENASYDNFDD
jgi:hypothetical protein